MKLFLIVLITFFTSFCVIAQQNKIDSFQQLIKIEKVDTNRVFLLWNLAQLYQDNRPDTAMILAEQAYNLSKKIKYIEGESRSVNQIANAYNRVGNYPKALEYYIRKLKIEEKRNHPENLAIAYMNIGSVYLFQEEFRKALDHTFLANKIITDEKIIRLRKYSLLNIGDIYEKYNKLDSAMEYSNLAYQAALQDGDENITGTALNNLANICLKRNYFDLALSNYRKALPLLLKTGDDDVLCETTLGLAKTFLKINQSDSAVYYARLSFTISKIDGFLQRNLHASTFLKEYFNSKNLIDSAYKYQQEMLVVKDSINSTERIKQGQLIAFNEQVRQQELLVLKIKNETEWGQRLQYIGIGVLIPFLFLVTLYLRNKKVKPRYIEYLGLISLLMFFEYITLLLHPFVVNVTNHVPLFELVVFSTLAALLTRAHHRVEKWFIIRVASRKQKEDQFKTL